MWWWAWACSVTPIPPSQPGSPSLCVDPPGGRVGECPGDFVAPTVDGATFTLSDHAGQIVAVHLASPTGDLDRSISTAVEAVVAATPDLVAVDLLTGTPAPTEADAIAWADDLDLSFVVAFDPTGALAEDWGRTTQLPTVLVLDASGAVVARMHDRADEQLPEVIEDLFGG